MEASTHQGGPKVRSLALPPSINSLDELGHRHVVMPFEPALITAEWDASALIS
jgi:hypothetical protein